MEYYKIIKTINTGVINLKKDTIFCDDGSLFYMYNDSEKFNFSFLNKNDTNIFKKFDLPITNIEIGDYVEFKIDPKAIYIVTGTKVSFFRGKSIIYVDLRRVNRGDIYGSDKLTNVDITKLSLHPTYWFITSEGMVCECMNTPKTKEATEFRRTIGNYFSCKEDAKKKLSSLLRKSIKSF